MGAPYERGRELRSVLTSTTGGVLTKEAGAVTGDLEVATLLQQGSIAVSVRYRGANEWYTVVGSPMRVDTERMQFSHHERHTQVLAALTSSGRKRAGNELPVDLSDFLRGPGRGKRTP